MNFNYMNLKEKKQNLVDEFNKNQDILTNLQNRQQQIIGQVRLVEELEKEQEEKEQEPKNKPTN